MNLTIDEINNICVVNKNNPELVKKLLKRIFSFKENIVEFGLFFFPHLMTNKSPDFHIQMYELMFKEGNDAWAAPRGHAKSTTIGNIFIP